MSVSEVGTTSAPLKSASFFLGSFCQKYNEDFMLCKQENGRFPEACLKEGRRVTRCTQDFIRQLNKACKAQWEEHYECLENEDHFFWKCRAQERPFNKCVLGNLGLTKTIPGSPEGKTQVHELENPIFHPISK